jgi:Tol biopolymer transport system component/DNA-binding winged helix-turn-helix (wHTH) protein
MSRSAIPLLPLVRFGPYEFDARSGELRKFGIRIKLREQPVKILTLLLENAGEVVLREEIRLLLWPNDTVVDFHHGINVAVQKLRDALAESAEDPRYVKTVASRGYRFIGAVERVGFNGNGSAASEAAPPPPRVWPVRRVAAWIGAAVLTLSIAVSMEVRWRGTPADPPVVRFSVLPPEGTAFGGMPSLAVSPDGRRIVFVTLSKDGYRTWLRSLSLTNAVRLAEADGGSLPFWSPDSRSIAFFAADGKLKRIDLDGSAGPGVARTLCGATDYAGGTWNENGVILFANQGGALYKVADTGGSPIVVRVEGGGRELSCRFPWFLPDGRHFLFEANVTPSSETHARIRAGSLDSKESEVLLEADSNAIFVRGRLLYIRDKTLFAQPFDSRRLVTTGDPVPVAEHVTVFTGLGDFAAAQNGPLVYIDAAEPSFELASFDRSGQRLSTSGDPVNPGFHFAHPNFSPAGKAVAVDHIDGNNSNIWIYDTASGRRTRFTFDAANDIAPVWSPDGRDIVFASSRQGHLDLYRKAFEGGKPEELIYADGDDKYPTSFSRDGKFLLFDRHRESEADPSIWVLALAPEQPGAPLKPFPLLPKAHGESHGEFSPDGGWIAYQSHEAGTSQIYVARFDPLASSVSVELQISAAEAFFPRWRKDGKEIFYSSRRRLMAASVTLSKTSVKVGEERPLIDPGQSLTGYAVSPDGQRFVLRLRRGQAAFRPITVVQNWDSVPSR